MGNLRILKKLSKRAAPLLVKLGDTREQFTAPKDDAYHGWGVFARKHWERSPCHPSCTARNDYSGKRGAEIRYVTRQGRHMIMRPPSHPRKGTVMVGGMSGYYEPEWDEECAWSALLTLVHVHFTDWSTYPHPTPLREIRTPTEVFAAARELLSTPQPNVDEGDGK